MGTCMARCWPPPFLDPRSYQPVRSRYLPDQDTIQVTDVRSTQSSCSTGSASSLDDVSLNNYDGPALAKTHHEDYDDDDDAGGDNEDEKLLMSNGDDGDDVHPLFSILSSSDNDDFYTRKEDDSDTSLLIPSEDEDIDTNPQFAVISGSNNDSLGNNPYYTLIQVDKEEELELTTPQHYRPRRSTMRSITLGSLVSLTEPESPITNSIDLEWEPEAGLGNCGQRSPMERESSTQLSASNTADTGSWVPRSACSTPNSLEWDFRASTLSLRGAEGEGGWQQQRHRQDAETEQLLYEIEQLAARALADTGHGLAPDATNQQDHTNR